MKTARTVIGAFATACLIVWVVLNEPSLCDDEILKGLSQNAGLKQWLLIIGIICAIVDGYLWLSIRFGKSNSSN